MQDDGQLHQETMVRFERLLPGPVGRVWEYLTHSEQLTWLGGGAIEPRSGGVVNIAEGHIRGVVTQWNPPRLLTYTWNVFMPGDVESQFPESYVAYELKAQGDEVLLTLTHRPILTEYERRTLMGWHTLLEMLTAQLRGLPPVPREVVMERSRIRYGVENTSP